MAHRLSSEQVVLCTGLTAIGCSWWLLEFYILATSTVISPREPTWNSAHSWWLHSAALLGNHAVSNMTWYPSQSHYPDTKQISPYHILITPNAWLGNNKYQFYKSRIRIREHRSTKTGDGRSINSSILSGHYRKIIVRSLSESRDHGVPERPSLSR